MTETEARESQGTQREDEEEEEAENPLGGRVKAGQRPVGCAPLPVWALWLNDKRKEEFC